MAPSIKLPLAVKSPATVTALLATMGALAETAAVEENTVAALKVAAALIIKESALSLPNTASVFAVNRPETVMVLPAETGAVVPKVTGAFALMGAVEAKVVAELIVSVWVPVVPRTVLPLAVNVLEALLSVMLPVKDVRPLLSMTRRSMGWLVLVLLLPVALVLNIRLPPKLPVASCIANTVCYRQSKMQ